MFKPLQLVTIDFVKGFWTTFSGSQAIMTHVSLEAAQAYAEGFVCGS